MSMTKRNLVVKIAKESGIIQKDVTKIVQMTLEGIADEITAGNTVELRNFGVFKTVMCKARIGRNPRNPGTDIVIPAHQVIKFRAGKELKKRIEELNPGSLKG